MPKIIKKMSKKILFLSFALIIGSTFFFAKNSYANVQKKVTCVFQGSVSAQECHTMNTENSNSLYSGGGCGGTGSCGWVDTNAPGTQITWGSSCVGSAYTVSDGVDETVTFDCTIPAYSIALNPSGTDGTIVSSPAGIICHVINRTKSGYCGASFSAGTAVALIATPASGGVFTSWSTSTGDSGGCTGGSPQICTLTMNQNHQLGAVFSSAQQSIADFIVTDLGVKYFSGGNPGNYYYATVKNIGGNYILTINLDLGMNFEGNLGWLGGISEPVYVKKSYTIGDQISSGQEIEIIGPSTN
ncbi:MAG: hypothetical protein Q7K35_04045 [bacterium]|nr:hypothetical protein [bacterium]